MPDTPPGSRPAAPRRRRSAAAHRPERDYVHRSLPGIGDEASYDGRGTVHVRWGNLTATFSGKTGDEDWIDPELAAAYGQRVVANLEEM